MICQKFVLKNFNAYVTLFNNFTSKINKPQPPKTIEKKAISKQIRKLIKFKAHHLKQKIDMFVEILLHLT
jgi:hypothetical protein